ncbi:MAG: hypothetical protein BBJ57_04580 [Desulfobacterales bacterium PC51MH44]|nr:MAG: hypothetical protein BBJ57_04580 [Desulfobacterales bacterium PC51MH44]
MQTKDIIQYKLSVKSGWKKSLVKGFCLLVLGTAVITAGIYSILRCPAMPYNIRELFLGDGSLIHTAVFSMAILWIGITGALIGSQIAQSKVPYLSMPALVALSGVISLLLLYGSVTSESISDIVGSSNVYWFVMNKNIWGDFGVKVFTYLDSPKAISLVERVVRYLALYSPVILCLVVFNATFVKNRSDRWFMALVRYIIYSLPWFFLCKVIAFDFSSTDNLNELIAGDGTFGIGGGGFLYLLLILISFNGTLLAWASKRKGVYWALLSLVCTFLAIPAGWFLLKNGLVTNLVKYETTYSGVDFLLGPDRKNLLSETELFFRWSLLQTGIVLILAYGQRIVIAILSMASPMRQTEASSKP